MKKNNTSYVTNEFIRWFINPRMIILLVAISFIYKFAVIYLIENAEILSEKVNFLEPFIAISNSEVVNLLLPITFFMLISDFPDINTNTVFVLPRIGKKKWLISQIKLLSLCALSFLLVIIIGTIIPLIPYGIIDGKWSKVVTDFVKLNPQYSGNPGATLILPNLYYQYKIWIAFLYSFILGFLYYLIIGLTVLYFSISNKKVLGFSVVGAMIFLGSATIFLSNPMKWLFPMANCIIWIHNKAYVSEINFPVWVSMIYMLFLVIVLLILLFKRIKNYNFDTFVEGDV